MNNMADDNDPWSHPSWNDPDYWTKKKDEESSSDSTSDSKNYPKDPEKLLEYFYKWKNDNQYDLSKIQKDGGLYEKLRKSDLL